MRKHARLLASLAVALFLALLGATLMLSGTSEANSDERGARAAFEHAEAVGTALFESPQAQPIALSPKGSRVYVANTTSNSVSVIDTRKKRVVREIPVGIQPVGLAVRPDGMQLWVSNHISDSVSVIDTNRDSATYLNVVATIQDLDPSGATRFDEPVGIAFASDTKAYIALSASNEIAVVEIVGTRYEVRPERILITAQDPRAIAVRDGRLYVAAFESTNQTEISICDRSDGTEQCTIGVADPAPVPGAPLHIVRDPAAPDRDLFVFDTADESPVAVVSHLGTLLYGVTVDGRGRVFVSHTEARNDVNGLDGGSLPDLENRIYLNRIAAVDCLESSCSVSGTSPWELEPPVGQPIANGDQAATPYGIAVSDDDRTLVVTAAASNRVFTVDADSGEILGSLDVGAGPRGVALRSSRRRGAPKRAYVLNTLGNSVSVIDVSDPSDLRTLETIPVGSDPTPEPLRRGRIAFNDANASSSGTFACASCHPDGHVDQLVWRIGAARAPEASPNGGAQEPRVTQPVKGLRNTLPLHWDGTLGDPFGGPNGFVGVGGNGGSDCELDAPDDQSCFLDLVMASLGAVMCDQTGDCPPGGNRLTGQERSAMALYLSSVWHSPPPLRATNDRITASARDGFSDFYVDQGGLDQGTCASGGCHELPLGVATNGDNSGLGAFDSPSMRGMTDRFVKGSTGGNSTHEVLSFNNDPIGLPAPFNLKAVPSEFPFDPAVGYTEASVWAAGFYVFRLVNNVGPVDIFRMVQEASTGTSGATGRQITLSQESLDPEVADATLALLRSLEDADARGVVALTGQAKERRRKRTQAVAYLADEELYRIDDTMFARDDLLDRARSKDLIVTLTANLPAQFGLGIHRQPLLALATPGAGLTGDPALPVLPSQHPILAKGIDVREGAVIFLDGEPVGGTVSCLNGSFQPEFCSSKLVEVRLDVLPTEPGLKLLQIQNPAGPLSNELPVCVAPVVFCH